MLKGLIKEESGLALPLAVMMIVIIGVMGAGLLVFVTTDLGSVIESNQGQKAFNLADAGVQAAKSHLMADAYYLKYDGVTDELANPPNYESTWSCGDWNPVAKTCSATGKTPDLDPGSGNTVKVWIQYLKPATTTAKATAVDPPDVGVYAPEVTPSGQTNYALGTDYFKVISQATVGQTKRKIEAIYNTVSLDTPRAYFTPGNIVVSGTAKISNISLFSLGSVTLNGGAVVSGKDLAYRKWAATSDPVDASGYTPSYPNTYNSTPRGTDAAGIGAVGTINTKVPGRDYDASTCPKLVRNLTDPSTCSSPARITFPFNPNPDIPSLSDLASAAQAQTGFGIGGSNYYEITSNMDVRDSGAISYSGPKWPANSTVGTVVYVKFTNGATPTSNALTWSLPGDCGDPGANPPVPPNPPPVRGTLVVENGTVSTSNSDKRPLKGTVIVRGVPSDPNKPAYESTGNSCMQVFVNASGDIKVAGSVSPGTLERGNAAGTYVLKLASWRELYQ